MIGSVSVTLGGQEQTLRLTTRAMARIERVLDRPITAVMRGMDGELSVNAVAQILAAAWDDGTGTDVDQVFNILDGETLDAATTALGRVVEAAFPTQPAPERKAAGGGKKRGQTS